MSDFIQTMKDWQRMCDSMNKHGDGCCIACPLCGFSCGGVFEMPKDTNWQLLQEKVAAWAAEHPEPVYPTWAEWLIEQGLAEHKTVFSHEYHADALYVTDFDTALNKAVHKPIPANIAEKLGLKPKEGKNNV